VPLYHYGAAASCLAERIQKVFGGSMEWLSCSERAQRFAAAKSWTEFW